MSEKTMYRTITRYGKTTQYVKVCSCSGENYKCVMPEPKIKLGK